MKHAMKRYVELLLLCFLTFVALVGLAQAKEAKLKGAVYSPHPGVICDKRGGFCADTQGIAVALTKMYLGEDAEKKLMNMIRPEPGVQDFDTATFVLTNKVACDCKVKKCTVTKYNKEIDAAHTRALFGQ
jgi:hypothetical protein